MYTHTHTQARPVYISGENSILQFLLQTDKSNIFPPSAFSSIRYGVFAYIYLFIYLFFKMPSKGYWKSK